MPDSSAGTKEFYFVGSSQVAEDCARVFHAKVRRMFHVEQLKFWKTRHFFRRAFGRKRKTFHVEHSQEKQHYRDPTSRVLFCESGIGTGDCQSRSGRVLLAILT